MQQTVHSQKVDMEDEEGVATLAIGFFRSKSHQGRFPSVHENVALYLDGRTDEQIDNTTSHSFFFRLPPINNADRLRCRDQPKVQYRCLQTSILLDNIFVHFASVTSTTFCVAPSILWAVFLNQPQSTFASVRSTRRILRAVFFNQCTSSSPSDPANDELVHIELYPLGLDLSTVSQAEFRECVEGSRIVKLRLVRLSLKDWRMQQSVLSLSSNKLTPPTSSCYCVLVIDGGSHWSNTK